MEYLASSAERDSIKYMQIKFMQDHQDQEFVGVIIWSYRMGYICGNH